MKICSICKVVNQDCLCFVPRFLSPEAAKLLYDKVAGHRHLKKEQRPALQSSASHIKLQAESLRAARGLTLKELFDFNNLQDSKLSASKFMEMVKDTASGKPC